jgi:hypothetical protein
VEYMPRKDPEDVELYSADFTDWLALVPDDELDTTTWTPQDGITAEDRGFVGPIATVEVSGGTVNVTYDVLCHAVSTSGREKDWTLRIPVKQQ